MNINEFIYKDNKCLCFLKCFLNLKLFKRIWYCLIKPVFFHLIQSNPFVFSVLAYCLLAYCSSCSLLPTTWNH